jgi:hypothetical protein
LLAFGVAAMAMLMGSPQARAQAERPVPPALPPLSVPKAMYYNDNPDAWNAFLAQLPRLPGSHSTPTDPRFNAPSGGTWTDVTNVKLNVNGGMCNPLLLTDGTVMIHDCDEPDWWKLTPDINGDYATGTWTQLASMPIISGTQYEPQYNASAVLPDGRVIVFGGEYNGGSTGVWVSFGAIYDPLANTWTAVARPTGWPAGNSSTAPGIGDAQSVVLADGTWMLGACCANPDVDALFDASTLKFTATGAPNAGMDYQDEQGYNLLPNGNVLTIDIWTDYESTNTTKNPTNAEQYNPDKGTWSSAGNTPVSLVDPFECGNFEIGPAALRPDGTLVAFGGNTGCAATAGVPPNYTGAADPTAIYDSGTGAWSAGPKVPEVCTSGGATYPSKWCTLADAPAAVLPNGNVLFAASSGYGQPVTHFFEFSSATSSPANSIAQVSDPKLNASTSSSFYYNLLVLPSGQVMSTDFSDTAELYNPTGSPDSSWAPTVSAAPPAVYAGATYTISGTQFNGLSQGGYYGDDDQASTNYPILRIQNSETNHVFFGRTFDHSTMSVAPGTAGSTNFTVPAHVEPGPNNLLTIIANGIASTGDSVVVARGGYAKGPNFNGDKDDDILWRNADGAVEVWLMNGATTSAANNLGILSNAWSIVGTGDFNGNGTSDILFRSNTGGIQIWFMNKSGTVASKSLALGGVPNALAIVGTGDFNGDGTSDILFRNSSTGAVEIWFMSGGTASKKAAIGTLTNAWTIVGTGDFNGDGVSDILWRDNTTGEVQVWFMNKSGTVASKSNIGTLSNVWSVDGTGDFNGDGVCDILWHSTTGEAEVWYMNKSGTVTSKTNIGSYPVDSWSIAGTGDFDGNGTTDILWRDYNTGDNEIWFMNTSGTVASKATVGSFVKAWTIVQ